MEPSNNKLCVTGIDRINEGFNKYNAEFIDDKIKRVEDFIETHEKQIAFTDDEELEEKLLTLAEKLETISGMSASAKRLATEVESLARTIFLPEEIIHLIYSYLDAPSLSQLSCTSKFHRDSIAGCSKLSIKILLAQALEEAWETASKSNDMQKVHLSRIIKEISRSDPERALTLVETLGDASLQKITGTDPENADQLQQDLERTKDDTYCHILGILAKNAHNKALLLGDDLIKSEHYRGNLQSCVAINIAQKNIDQALEIARNFNEEVREYGEGHRYLTLKGIMNMIAESRPDQSIEVFKELLEFITDTKTKYHPRRRDALVTYILDEISLVDYKLALENVYKIQFNPLHSIMIGRIAENVAKIDVDKGLEIVELLEDKVSCLVRIARQTFKVNPVRSKDILQKAIAINKNEKSRNDEHDMLDIAACLVLFDTDKAMEFAMRVRYLPSGCLSRFTPMAFAIAPYKPEEALKIIEKITDSESKDCVLKDIVLAYLPENPVAARETADKITDLNKKELALNNIAIVIARSDLALALKIVDGQPEGSNSKTLYRSFLPIKIALRIADKEPIKAKELIMKALNLSKKREQSSIKINEQFGICKMLQDYLTQV